MSTDKNDQEPSMEEILSSIRRIIADDQDEEAAGAKPVADPAKAKLAKPTTGPADEDVLDLTQVVGSGEPKPAAPPALEADSAELDLELEEDDDEPAPVAATPKPPAPRDSDEGLVSAPAASASTSAFARLAKAAASSEPPKGFGDKTVETFLTDLLKPMLKDWLDQNLEGVVERVVEQEVKKLARRAELM
ncbi:MAG: DUF2497 domain-containing protein [Geminicoccaceae bacterium]